MSIGIPDVAAADIDFRRFLRPGDRIVVSQGVAEPLSLTKALAEQLDLLPDLEIFVGITYSGVFTLDVARRARLVSYGAMGTLSETAQAGLLDIIACNYSDLPALMHDSYRPTVVLAQLSPADACGYHSLGVSVDCVAEALDQARVVIAEVNDQMPSTAGPVRIHHSRISASRQVSHPLMTIESPQPGPDEHVIAEHVATLVPDGATIQLGIGSVPAAVGHLLAQRRNLRVHSGLVGDWLVEFVQAGALHALPYDSEVVVTGAAMGTSELYALIGATGQIAFRPIPQLNYPEVLSRLERLMAINSALQVDLVGQVNAEVIGSRRVATIGGQTDFMRGAQLSSGGRAIVALAATASKGTRSRIVPRLDAGCVTTPQSYVDYVVTEYGVVSLRGLSLRQRAEAMIRIAAPQFRDELAVAAGVLHGGFRSQAELPAVTAAAAGAPLESLASRR